MHEENFSFTCDKCDKYFKSNTELQDHIESDHERIYYSCKNCSKKFQSELEFKEHMKSHEERIQFSCEQCPQKLKNKDGLKKHLMAHKDKNYCHMFNNFPRCKYGNVCLFLHEKAPVCLYDVYVCALRAAKACSLL